MKKHDGRQRLRTARALLAERICDAALQMERDARRRCARYGKNPQPIVKLRKARP